MSQKVTRVIAREVVQRKPGTNEKSVNTVRPMNPPKLESWDLTFLRSLFIKLYDKFKDELPESA